MSCFPFPQEPFQIYQNNAFILLSSIVMPSEESEIKKFLVEHGKWNVQVSCICLWSWQMCQEWTQLIHGLSNPIGSKLSKLLKPKLFLNFGRKHSKELPWFSQQFLFFFLNWVSLSLLTANQEEWKVSKLKVDLLFERNYSLLLFCCPCLRQILKVGLLHFWGRGDGWTRK